MASDMASDLASNMASDSPAPSPSQAYLEANREVVRRVVTQVSGSGLLVEPAALDAGGAVSAAEKVRDFLNMEIPNVRGGGPLDDAFKRMRRSARDFVRAAGADGQTFADDPAHFEACLLAMRLTLADVVGGLRE